MKFVEIKSILDSLPEPADKLEALMDLGRGLKPIPCGEIGQEIRGCSSRVEIFRNGAREYFANADSALVAGIVFVLITAAAENLDLRDAFASLSLQLGAARLTGAESIIKFLESGDL